LALWQITEWAVERYKQERLKDGVRVRQNRELAVLRNLYNRMRELKRYDGATPMPTQKKLLVHEPTRRLRYLEPDEEVALLDAADEPARTVILAGIYAGLRIKAAACHLTWSDVDLRRGVLTVPSAYAKNGKSRSVPLNRTLREALARLKATALNEFVFVNRRGERLRDIDAAIAAARTKAGLVDVTPHTTRHTFASRLAMRVSIFGRFRISAAGRPLELVKRYAHLSPDHKAQAVERITAAVFGSESRRDPEAGSGDGGQVAVST
jgi:integrase